MRRLAHGPHLVPCRRNDLTDELSKFLRRVCIPLPVLESCHVVPVQTTSHGGEIGARSHDGWRNRIRRLPQDVDPERLPCSGGLDGIVTRLEPLVVHGYELVVLQRPETAVEPRMGSTEYCEELLSG